MTIQVKATEQHFHVVPLIMLCDLVLVLSAQIKALSVRNESNSKSLCCFFRVLPIQVCPHQTRKSKKENIFDRACKRLFDLSLIHPLFP